MTTHDLAAILLVRTIEESRPNAVAPATRVDALGAAGDPNDAATWFATRANFLLTHGLAAYRAILSITDLPHRLAGPAFAGALLVGLLSNYLGPTAKIHVVLNPMSVLIGWNLLVFAIALIRAVSARMRGPHDTTSTTAPPESTGVSDLERPADTTSTPSARGSWWLRPLVPALWVRWQRSAQDASTHVADISQIARHFWAAWLTTARPLVTATSRRVLHAAAIGIAIGAVIGMYVRGLFFEYNVVWQSTFIRDFDSVQTLLTILLAPAATVLGQGPPSPAETSLLMTEAGAPAARWIHLYAASTVLFVVVPRAALICTGWLRELRMAHRMRPAFGEPYYREIIDHARTLRVAELSQAIEEDVRAECATFADSIATFVCAELYDARVVPRIEAFRATGGRISAFEDDLREQCLAFQTTLEGYLPEAQAALENALSHKVARTIGRDLTVEAGSSTGIAGDVDRASVQATTRIGSSIGVEITDAVGLAVSAAAALVAGAVAGGFGESIGIAIIAVLLETTGPIGFVVGAVLGVVIAVAGWWLGRDRLTESVKHISLPATVARLALRDSKLKAIISDGREQCRTSVRAMMQQTLEPLTPTIAEQIWTRIKPLLGAGPG